jgi:hypothetical protein
MKFQQARIASRKVYLAPLLCGFATVASACGGEAPPLGSQERVGQTIQPIIGGVASGTAHDAVIVLTTFRDGVRRSLCSATLVAPNLVLTARHCVSDSDGASACAADGTAVTGAAVKADRDATNLVVFVGKNGSVLDTAVEANGNARGAKLVVDSSTTLCNHDIAFLILDKNLDAPVATLRLGALAADERVSAIGWGVDETGSLAPSREIRADMPLIGVGPGLYPENEKFGYGEAEFMIGESACAGDSGGPALAKSGAVLGVASRAGNGLPKDPTNYAFTCVGTSAHAVYTQLRAHKDLVARAFQEAGAEAHIEVEPKAAVPAPEAPAAAAPSANLPAEAPPALPSAPVAAPPAEAGGCSLSSEPQSGSVEYAAGMIALLASLMGLRRRFSRKNDDGRVATHRERLPSMP